MLIYVHLQQKRSQQAQQRSNGLILMMQALAKADAHWSELFMNSGVDDLVAEAGRVLTDCAYAFASAARQVPCSWYCPLGKSSRMASASSGCCSDWLGRIGVALLVSFRPC